MQMTVVENKRSKRCAYTRSVLFDSLTTPKSFTPCLDKTLQCCGYATWDDLSAGGCTVVTKNNRTDKSELIMNTRDERI